MKKLFRLLLLSLTALALALPAAAQSLDWEMVGSAGVPDDGTTSLGLYACTGPSVGPKTNAIATLQFRYPVTNTYGSASSLTPAWATLAATYVDNHSTGSVTAALMEVDKCSNVERQLCVINSADGSDALQCETCSFNGGLDFANHAYYVDVTIVRTDLPATPRLVGLAIY